jgi:hypothetical protein
MSSVMSIEYSTGTFWEFPPLATVSTDNSAIDSLICVAFEGQFKIKVSLSVHTM